MGKWIVLAIAVGVAGCMRDRTPSQPRDAAIQRPDAVETPEFYCAFRCRAGCVSPTGPVICAFIASMSPVGTVGRCEMCEPHCTRVPTGDTCDIGPRGCGLECVPKTH